jgi:glycosyltransferase involved in cell wall biosynthesis
MYRGTEVNMRIGIMLRSFDEKGGIGVYSRNITRELIELDRENRYILFYRNSANLGIFAPYENVSERLIGAPNKAAWDQLSIPKACVREKVDVLFHPKFTVPIFAPCKTVMVLHGAGWFMPDFQHFWSRSDLRNVNLTMPVYLKKASAVLSVSQITTEVFNKKFRPPQGKISTVYFAPARNFKRITDPQVLEHVRARYALPERFIFTLSGYDRGDRKNFRGILKAFQELYGRTDHKLVVGGKDCHKFKIDYEIPDTGYGKDIIFTGWIDQEDLPAFYSLADLFLYPSNVEAFPIPITEALACGTPIVTSDANGLKELVGDAALLVDPRDPSTIAQAVYRLLCSPDLRGELSEKGTQRSQMFTWDRCSRQTLDILTKVVTG